MIIGGEVAKAIGGRTFIQGVREFFINNRRFAPGLGFSGLAGATYAAKPVVVNSLTTSAVVAVGVTGGIVVGSSFDAVYHTIRDIQVGNLNEGE